MAEKAEPLLANESDVEQKFIIDLLTAEYPLGLGYSKSDFRTKPQIRRVKLDKGNKAIVHCPDYVIIVRGLPIVIVEAKRPGADLEEAYREGRLYASEINAEFPSGLNPCSRILVSNGESCIAGSSDSDQDRIEISSENLDVSDPQFFELLQFLRRDTVVDIAEKIQGKIRGNTKFLKPNLLFGPAVRETVVSDNSFGANLSIEYKYLFNPETREERQLIAQNAYVASKRKLAHVDPIDRIIRAAPRKEVDGIHIGDTKAPNEVITKLQSVKGRNEVILLIGGVGSGKSTFVDYLRDVALPIDLRKQLFWINLNLNFAPNNREMLEDWVLNLGIDAIAAEVAGEEANLRSKDLLEKLFHKELRDFQAGPVSVFPQDSIQYSEAYFNELQRLQLDKVRYFNALTNHFFASRGIKLIIVLDNADKRDREIQLLMFSIANWMKESLYCTVFLPLRQVTFDQYRFQTPLNTAIKDTIFRIDPPRLQEVIYSRVEYLLREVQSDQRDFYYTLQNGMRVPCKRHEVTNYLGSILKALFENLFFRRLTIGLADKDVRRGLEIFLDFCKSGFIQEQMIFKMRTSPTTFELPNHLVTRILLRGKRRFYSDSHSYVKNLFDSQPEDTIPDPFCRLSILRWLYARYRIQGPNRSKGYHSLESLLQDLSVLGHDDERVRKESQEMLQFNLIVNDSQTHELNPEDLLCITSAGIVHIDLLNNLDYLSTVSEDTWFRDNEKAKRIKENISGLDIADHLNRLNALQNSKVLLDYLQDYKEYFKVNPEVVLVPPATAGTSDLSDLTQSADIVRRALEKDEDYIFLRDVVEKYKAGDLVDCEVTGIQEYGIFVEFGLGASGLIHRSRMPQNKTVPSLHGHFELGDTVVARIIEYNVKHHKFDLELPS